MSPKNNKNSIKKIAGLTKTSDDELELFKQVKSGNKKAKELIVKK